MIKIPFHPDAPLLLFECRIEYKSIAVVWLALDTGASTTIIANEVLHNIGFHSESLKEFVTLGDASQSHLVPKVEVPCFSLGNLAVKNLEVLSYTLPEEHGIDGLIGLNFLRRFKKFIVDFEQATLFLQNYS